MAVLVIFYLWALTMVGLSSCQESQGSVLSSFSRRNVWLRQHDWTYLRVELPFWFSSMTIDFVSNAGVDMEQAKRFPNSDFPVVCFKGGSPPLPDVSDTSLKNALAGFVSDGYFGIGQNTSYAEQCVPFQKNLSVTLTTDQVSPGVWYMGFFNGLGPTRTQSKMIRRGKSYMFSANITVQGCSTTTILGPYCNNSIEMIPCSQSSRSKNSRNLLDLKHYNRASMKHSSKVADDKISHDHSLSLWRTTGKEQTNSNTSVLVTEQKVISCNSTWESACIGYGELNTYFFDMVGIASQFVFVITDIKISQTSVNNSGNSSGILVMSYARHNAMPSKFTHDYSADVSTTPLIVNSPKIGRWYVSFQAVNQTVVNGTLEETFLEGNLCFSFNWQVLECLDGKVGLNCTWDAHKLQRTSGGSGAAAQFYYLPEGELGSSIRSGFPLEQHLSNYSVEQTAWTYFFLDIPPGAAGQNLHIRVSSNAKVAYEVYSKFGGLPSIDTWDYFANTTTSSHDLMFLPSVDSSEKSIDFYILYAREGTWSIGIKHPADGYNKYQTTMFVSLEGCPKSCSHNGACHTSVEESGLTFYSYCECDRDHGSFDCSSELVSHSGHIWQTIFLVGSNAAAALPAFWALRQKAFSEWVLFTSSGVSSALYHACDRGTWCVLSFSVLQFLDFWLSFMAVVSTFIYMTTIDDASKRVIHTSVSILTALLAITNATRSANIALVVAIGTLGLLIGWFLEFSTGRRLTYCPQRFDINMTERWQTLRNWFWSLVRKLQKRFRWQYIVLGFIALALAATSWTLETSKSYWIWHSLWHITIYTSSFFFLCATRVNNEQHEPSYELTRQNSSSRDGVNQ